MKPAILNILSRNAVRRHRTRHPQDTVPYPGGFRGTITHEVPACTACGTCVYVCSPGAIVVDNRDEQVARWTYFAGQCTFCGRCVEYCPTHALTFAKHSGPVTKTAQQMRVTDEVVRRSCLHCGRPVIPLPVSVLAQMYGDPPPEDVRERQQLCERCRGRTTAERLKPRGPVTEVGR